MSGASAVPPTICFICTGNAARSVMARAMFADRAPGYRAVGAGTLVLEGLPMSSRTRNAMADLVVAMEPSHVAWIRRHHPAVAARTATLPRLVRDLPPDGPLAERVASLGLSTVEVGTWEEVVDPASGEQADFDACAATLDDLVGRLVELLGPAC